MSKPARDAGAPWISRVIALTAFGLASWRLAEDGDYVFLGFVVALAVILLVHEAVVRTRRS